MQSTKQPHIRASTDVVDYRVHRPNAAPPCFNDLDGDGSREVTQCAKNQITDATPQPIEMIDNYDRNTKFRAGVWWNVMIYNRLRRSTQNRLIVVRPRQPLERQGKTYAQEAKTGKPAGF
jgi:hypothetical protein